MIIGTNMQKNYNLLAAMHPEKVERISAKEFNDKYPTYFKTEKKRNKYGAKKLLLDNKKFDSQSEGNFYCELKLQQRGGLIKGFDCQVKEELFAYGKHICDYYVDFVAYHLDGRKEYIEHKSAGTITRSWQMKFKMLKAKYAKEIDQGKVEVSIDWY